MRVTSSIDALVYLAMTAIGKPARARVGKTQVSGPFQPPVGNQWRVTPKNTMSSIANTKLGMAMPMIEIPVET